MEAAAHHAGGFSGVPQHVGEEFVRADQASDSKPYLAAGIIFVAPDGDVLMLRRSNEERNYAGHWALPGGKAEHGETALEAAEREAHEEIGHAPAGAEPVLVDQVLTPFGFSFSTFIKPVENKFTPSLNFEHSGFCWAPLGELLPSPLHPGVKRVLTSIANYLEPLAQDEEPDDRFTWKEGDIEILHIGSKPAPLPVEDIDEEDVGPVHVELEISE
jgi:8-oxo-dGTP pyrophosphatase MutT (NUDIX family)